MISDTFVSVRITPETGRRIEARIGTQDGLRSLPFPVRIYHHRYYNAETGEAITDRIVDWRDWRYRGQERPGPALERQGAQPTPECENPAPRSWYRRERPSGDMADKINVALKDKIRRNLLGSPKRQLTKP